MKKLSLSILAVLFVFTAIAQKKGAVETEPWNNTAYMVQQYQQGAKGTISLTVYTRGKDMGEIAQKAKQVGLFHAIFMEIPGDGANIPALAAMHPEGSSGYQDDVEWWNSFLTGAGMRYVTNASLDSKKPAGKYEKKILQANHVVTINVKGLLEELKRENKIKVVDLGFKPAILIVPGDQWMRANGFVTTKDNQGVEEEIFSYKKAITHPDISTVMKACQNIYGGPAGVFEIKDIKANLDAIKMEEAKNNARNDANKESELDIFGRVLQADLWLKINLKESKNANGYNFEITMEGIDPYTKTVALPGYPVTKTSKINDPDRARLNAVEGAASEFKSMIMKHFQNVKEKGIQGFITFAISEEVDPDFNEYVDYKGKEYPFKKVLDNMVKVNSNDRQTDGSPSPTNRKYKVFIPLLTEDDFGEIERNNFELFADRIIAQLRSLGFGAKAEAEGMGTVTVILTEEL
jgi:hypothetical protein